MIKDEIQKQEGGDSSTNLQGKSIVIHQGITYSDAKEIALDVYKANFLKLSEDASKIAIERAEELTDKFLVELKEKNEKAVDSMGDPSMQMALYSAQKEYARTGDEDLQDLLVDILVQRAEHQNRDIKQVVLDESLEIAPKLTPEQFDALTLSWITTKTKHNGLKNLQTLENYFDSFLLPFLGTLTTDSSCYEHLQYLGCGTIVQLGGWGNLEKLFRHTYPGLFCKGITEDKVKDKIGDLEDVKGMIIPCLHNQKLFQIAAMDTEIINEKVASSGIDESFVPKLNSLFEQSRMNESEIKEYILQTRPELEKLFEIWKDTQLSSLTLTTVGYAIAQANLRRRSGEAVDMSIWIK